MTSLTLALFLSTAPSADPARPAATPDAAAAETSKPVGVTRDAEKELLEKHKKAKPRLPMPPPDPDNPLARVNNGAFRAPTTSRPNCATPGPPGEYGGPGHDARQHLQGQVVLDHLASE